MTPPPLIPSNSEQIPDQSPRPARFNWLLFLAAIFVPTFATMAAAAAHLKELAPALAIGGAGLSAAIAATMLARRIRQSNATRVGIGVLLFIAFTGAFVTMNCIGCLASGYPFNLQ